MIKLEKIEVVGWEHAIRGMRNPMNSWDKSDSAFGCYTSENHYCGVCEGGHDESCPDCFKTYKLGPNDHELMMKLAKGGPVHAKYRRMIAVYVDITAPLYWWKEFDTYKVGTVANSCSTMHKIHAKEFTIDDFSHDHLFELGKNAEYGEIPVYNKEWWDAKLILEMIIKSLNHYRQKFIETKDKRYWWQMIQLLPSSYNQRRTVQLNYAVLKAMYHARKNHKLDEWHVFCDFIRDLPYSDLITGGDSNGV